jgi:hypothetical protein
MRTSRKQSFQLTSELICLLILVLSKTLSADNTIQRRMVGWLVNDEFKIIGKKAVVTKPETVTGIFKGGLKKNTKAPVTIAGWRTEK